MSDFNIHDFLSLSLILFVVIDPIGNIPIIIDIKRKVGKINPLHTIITSIIIVSAFLFYGDTFLSLLKIDNKSFSLAGAIILFVLGLEMILNISIFKMSKESIDFASIVPIAFPILIGTGTLTTILTMKQTYNYVNILSASIVNILITYPILNYTDWIEKKMGGAGVELTRKIMGVILISFGIQVFRDNLF